MSTRLKFQSATRGSYQIELPTTEDGRLLDKSLTVTGSEETSRWQIDREEACAGFLEISGTTNDGLWFVLRLSETPEIEYWGDQQILGTDIALT